MTGSAIGDEPAPLLLTTRQMAEFVARGFLEFPALIDDSINTQAEAELRTILDTWGSEDRPNAPDSGQPWTSLYPQPSALGAVLRHPTVAGAIQSLVGPDAVFDHDFVHLRPSGDLNGQRLHCDAIIDPNLSFDIQVFYFPHQVADDGGGTGFVPATHLRLIHETDVGRYRHLKGERQWAGPAGSVLIFHHGLWHRGMPNPGSRDRLMYKLRLNPSSPQVLQWNTDDLAEVSSANTDHIFARFDPTKIAMSLRHREPWMGEADFRLEVVARTRLWRHLTNNPKFDVDWYLTRLERRSELGHR
ncbi:MAG: phytanoyl-CoA dioxygenase [Actinobacteria bacterium]|nr:phytanoyl-CoA dioxygenase [Actinomycetota bacterium]